MLGIVRFGVAAQVAASSTCRLIIVPGCLAVPAIQESHFGGTEIDKVHLLTTVGIVACVARDS